MTVQVDEVRFKGAKRISRERSRLFDGTWSGEAVYIDCDCGGVIMDGRWDDHRATDHSESSES